MNRIRTNQLPALLEYWDYSYPSFEATINADNIQPTVPFCSSFTSSSLRLSLKKFFYGITEKTLKPGARCSQFENWIQNYYILPDFV